nr:MAG TPA: Cytosine specific methyltransferase [Caudoviricetes sp.]
MAIKLLIGGSPCTYWSIEQKNNRETTAEGLGWELFKNYLIAKEKFKPDLFLYENNKSAAQAIKDQIKHELGVWDGTLLMRDSGARYIEINSALVSAQNRQRFYVHNCGEVGQPEDRGILLKDILESGVIDKDKSYCLKHQAGNTRDYFKKHHTQIAYEPVNACEDGKARTIKAQYAKNGIANFITNGGHAATGVAEPIRVGALPRPNGELSESAGMRIYSTDGKGRCLIANGGGQGAQTGLYAIPTDKPIYEVKDGLITIKDKQYPIKLPDGYYIIRKLTVTECERLQTLPDGYTQQAGVSETQCYKGIGNGWTAEAIIHILSNALKNVPKDEKIVVLSMYDGIGTGRYCLDKMGFTNVVYHAYEIDKYAMKIALSNYPDIIQHGDAFQVRSAVWHITNN